MGDQWLPGGDSTLVRVCQTDPWGTTAALLRLIVPPCQWRCVSVTLTSDSVVANAQTYVTSLPSVLLHKWGKSCPPLGERGRQAEPSQDANTSFTCLYSSLDDISLLFTLKIASFCCDNLVLNVFLDCFQKASQNFPSRGIAAVNSLVIVMHMFSPFFSSLSTLPPSPENEICKTLCTAQNPNRHLVS